MSFRQLESAPEGVVRDFLHYWEGRRGERGVPARRDIDPVDIPRLLPFITIADIEDAPFRVRYRLAGTAVVEATGREITGLYLDELAPVHVTEGYHAIYRRACNTGGAFFAAVKWEFTDERRGWYDLGAFPLSTDGTRIDMVMTVEDYSTLKYEYGRVRPV